MSRRFSVLLAFALAVPAWAQFPANNSSSQNRRPNVGYDFHQSVRDMRLWLDGQDLTVACNKNGSIISILLNHDLGFGPHTVQVQARNFLNQPISKSWTFKVLGPNNSNINNPNGIVNDKISRLNPSADEVIQNSRPRITVDFTQNLRSGRAFLDGKEVTGWTGVSGGNLAIQVGNDLAPGTHRVMVEATFVNGLKYIHSWSFKVGNPNNNNNNPGGGDPGKVTRVNPAMGETIQTLRPRITADFSQNLQRARTWIDGVEQTSRTGVAGNNMAIDLASDLTPGKHQVSVEVTFVSGQVYRYDWPFQAQGQAAPSSGGGLNFSVEAPVNNTMVGRGFQVMGQAPAGKNVRVTVKPLPNKNQLVEFQGTADPNGNYSIPVECPSWVSRGMNLEVTVQVLGGRRETPMDPIVIQVYQR
ncbi:hypothetical protein JST97_09700 [bacterium]|nr:hypothetical protein [bacterium]